MEIYQMLQECEGEADSTFTQEVLADMRNTIEDHGRLSGKQIHQLRTLHKELFE